MKIGSKITGAFLLCLLLALNVSHGVPGGRAIGYIVNIIPEIEKANFNQLIGQTVDLTWRYRPDQFVDGTKMNSGNGGFTYIDNPIESYAIHLFSWGFYNGQIVPQKTEFYRKSFVEPFSTSEAIWQPNKKEMTLRVDSDFPLLSGTPLIGLDKIPYYLEDITLFYRTTNTALAYGADKNWVLDPPYLYPSWTTKAEAAVWIKFKDAQGNVGPLLIVEPWWVKRTEIID